jgi:hypothetical protein
MISRAELRRLARARLRDSQALLAAGSYDGAVYLCGYVVELALKARICTTLNWSGYPSTRSEFQDYQSFRTHDLEVLLNLSGRGPKIRGTHITEWSVANRWDPELRYRTVGSATRSDVVSMIAASTILLRVL